MDPLGGSGKKHKAQTTAGLSSFRFRDDMSGCQKYGSFLGTLNIRCRSIIGIQKGTIILTTTHMEGTSKSKSVGMFQGCVNHSRARLNHFSA